LADGLPRTAGEIAHGHLDTKALLPRTPRVAVGGLLEGLPNNTDALKRQNSTENNKAIEDRELQRRARDAAATW